MPGTLITPTPKKCSTDERPTATDLKKALKPTVLIIPDMLGASRYPLRVNRAYKHGDKASESWLFRNGNLSEKKRKGYHGLKAGLLTAMCYPDASQARFRTICDFINYLFHLDNISDNMDKAGTARTADVVLGIFNDPVGYQSSSRLARMTRDFWKRFSKNSSGTAQRRFIQGMEAFFDGVGIETGHRQTGGMYELEDYIQLRRDTSGCKPCFALIEYGYGLNIPNSVMEHDTIQSLSAAASDVISWSNDIYSFNVEQSRGDTHNMVMIIMQERNLKMQDAIDFVGELVIETLARFEEDKLRLPSWGGNGRIDREVAMYVQGLEDWMAGNFHWSFDSERYFGKLGREAKQTRQIALLPRREN